MSKSKYHNQQRPDNTTIVDDSYDIDTKNDEIKLDTTTFLVDPALVDPAISIIEPKATKNNKEFFKGGMLTGAAIIQAVNKGEIKISNFDPKNINPNSYNLTLSPLLKVYENRVLDSKGKNPTKRIIIPEKGFILQPGELYIGATNERTSSSLYIPQIEGRSTFGRLGLTAHITAGFGDFGFDGTWTLEITVIKPLIIYPNVEIAQISYFTPYGESSILYDGRYQGQIEPIGARAEYTKKVYVGE